MSYFGGARSPMGDPGFFSTLGKIGRVALGALTGGPVGAVTAAASAFAPTPRQQGTQTTTYQLPGLGPLPALPILERVSPMPFGPPGALPAIAAAPGMACPSGYHPNKSGYYTSGGYVPPGTKCVRNRRTNFANGRALTRSISRVSGFGRQVKRAKSSVASANRALNPGRR